MISEGMITKTVLLENILWCQQEIDKLNKRITKLETEPNFSYTKPGRVNKPTEQLEPFKSQLELFKPNCSDGAPT